MMHILMKMNRKILLDPTLFQIKILFPDLSQTGKHLKKTRMLVINNWKKINIKSKKQQKSLYLSANKLQRGSYFWKNKRD